MALEGSLKDFGLADILQLIFFQRKTGVLTIESRMDRIRLLFIEGHITGAESKRRIEANRLGKVLVKKEIIREEDLQGLLDEQRSTNIKLGNLLVRKGLVSKEQLEEILTGQIKETIIQVFGWKDGTYEFTPQAVPADKDIPISIDTQHLLMEGLRIVDEWTLIEGKITLDTVFSKKSGFTGELTREEEDILSLVDGETDVSTIIDLSGLDDFEVSKTLVSLLENHAIELTTVAPVLAEMPAVAAKKPSASYRIIPVVAVVLALCISLPALFLDGSQIFKNLRAAETIDTLRFEIRGYNYAHGAYPEKLGVISEKPDPWGNPYRYTQNGYAFIVLSAGPDGVPGTADDIY
ncbi:MAG: DUF4388 domain-containing protein [Nitrospirota bacterium]